jgi:3-oxoacyl-[acyl-carrier protein] reductase
MLCHIGCALTVDGMMARGFGHRQHRVAQRRCPSSARPVERRAPAGQVHSRAHTPDDQRNVDRNLLPGTFDTDGQREHVRGMVDEKNSYEKIWQGRIAQNPAGRFVQAEELGAYCAFLCSAQAGYITAQNLLIDGGNYPGTY